MPPDPTGLTSIITLCGQLAGLVIVVGLFIRAIDNQRTAFMDALKQQRDECNKDRESDRLDRAESRREYLTSFQAGMAEVRGGLDNLAREIHK